MCWDKVKTRKNFKLGKLSSPSHKFGYFPLSGK